LYDIFIQGGKMKKINSKMIIIVMLIAVFLNLAKGQEVNFDFDMKNKVENNFFELQSDIKPVILNSFETPDIKNVFLSKDRSYQTQCYQYNCRMEEVCGIKKSCLRFCQLVGATCAVAGTGIMQYYTGGTMPTASAAVAAAAEIGCSWACED
jgi:hypothetical protein